MLNVDGLHARVGSGFALEGITFSVAPGETLAVIGPNGSGKSTLLRLVAGLVAPQRGSITCGGVTLSEGLRVLVPPELRSVGLLMQEGVLFPHLRVRENVALGLGPGARGPAAERLVSEALEAARIAHLAGARPGHLSGGEAQRVALARALAQRPRVMLLDEPFHSLDAVVKGPILTDLRALVKDRGLAAVLVTHDAEEAAALADRVLVLGAGRVVQQGALDAIYRAPVDLRTARLFGEVGSIDAARARALGITLPEAVSGTVWFRPEALEVEPTSGDDGLEVIAVRPGRASPEVTLALPDGGRLVARPSGPTIPSPGGRARVRLAWALPPSSPGDEPS